MLRFGLLFNLIIICPLVISKRKSHKDSSASIGDLGGRLVSSLRNDVNIDLPVDEEYEDLRAELLAYHTALASLTNQGSRRSMKTTPCWKLGGICIDNRLCEGHRFLTEVAGCRNNLEVCCFTWNNFKVRDMKDKGIGVLAMPWTDQKEIGGKGVVDPVNSNENKRRKKKKRGVGRHDSPHHEMNKQNDKDHYELNTFERDHLKNPIDDEPHDNSDDNPQLENPPIVVILKTKRRNNIK